MNRTDKIIELMKKHGPSWSHEGELHFTTREHGDMINDEAGEEDIKEAVGLKHHIMAEVSDIDCEIDTIDEWTTMTFTLKPCGPVINEDDPRRDR